MYDHILQLGITISSLENNTWWMRAHAPWDTHTNWDGQSSSCWGDWTFPSSVPAHRDGSAVHSTRCWDCTLQSIPWRYSCGSPVTFSSDAPQSATAWWRLVSSLLASGLHHSVNKNFSLMTVRCCEARLVTRRTLIQWIPDELPKMTCGGCACFHLFGSITVREVTRGISLKGTTPTGRFTVWALSARRPDLFSGNPAPCLSPWRDGIG